jgi:hypothetical protein
VRVPEDAVSGKAVIRFELPEDSGLDSIPTELEVELTSAASN